MTETKFKLGDQVKIVNYGHLIWYWKEGISHERDISPEEVGLIGIIDNAHQTQGIDRYSIKKARGKVAWFDNGQLELIHRPEYKQV